MFYSHEVLTSRKYGVATVWLVATLGSKSTLKKVSRKAILDVDVGKACETIVAPDAPMALRLQSSLLYGVTRVYAQQCGYVLHDAETARNNMRTLTRMLHKAGLEPEGVHKATAAQLNLQDDPNFLPDLDLLPIDLDDLNSGFRMDEETQSVLSPHNSQLTFGSQQSIGGLMIPSNSSGLGQSIDGGDLFGGQGGSSRVARMEPAQPLDDDDLGLVFDMDGNVGMSDAPAQEPRATSGRVDRSTPVMSGGLGAALPGDDAMPYQPQVYDDGFVPFQDDYVFGEDAGPVQQPSTPAEEAAAPQKQKRKPKALELDRTTTLHNSDLTKWSANYLADMRKQLLAKEATKKAALAKQNAEHWFLGAGSLLGQGMRGPLDLLSSVQLLEAFTGVDILNPGKKRAQPTDGSPVPQKRSRGESPTDEIARGQDDNAGLMYDDDMPMINDDTIEQGRDAPTPLDDRHLSSLFPWNQSAGSRQPTDAHVTSASFGGGPQLNLISRRGSRLTSASPLVGRGPVIPDLDTDGIQFGGGSDIGMGGLTGDEEFELFGPAAQVDTQTVAQTQWQRAALGAESANFLEFLQTAIDDADVARAEAAAGDEEDETLEGSVDFETILLPEKNSSIVAAQAMLHVLTLGTKGLINVTQEEHFGAINMRVVAA
ncbi:hypothetical protein PRZ48_001020 [Zasmidium cellare]|uniref:Rad21/Rec8-like protein N-terminal domain-containing protein n=1 Tax=Zasmidium cellare TaxID=395010 RepID=A0ABR0F1W4_ZASCE|nr:hypothetical protein PRZ48_001020 [Zasmidium cellare]